MTEVILLLLDCVIKIMKRTSKDGDIKITIEGPASAFKDIGKRKTAKSKSRRNGRRVQVVHR